MGSEDDGLADSGKTTGVAAIWRELGVGNHRGAGRGTIRAPDEIVSTRRIADEEEQLAIGSEIDGSTVEGVRTGLSICEHPGAGGGSVAAPDFLTVLFVFSGEIEQVI